jgi:hypothetical protein
MGGHPVRTQDPTDRDDDHGAGAGEAQHGGRTLGAGAADVEVVHEEDAAAPERGRVVSRREAPRLGTHVGRERSRPAAAALEGTRCPHRSG